MDSDDADDRVVFTERVSALPVLFGPLLAALGWLVEVLMGGPVHGMALLLIGLGLFAANSVWVYARKRFLSVTLTTKKLCQGREVLAVRKISQVTDVGTPVGARALGGGWTVPNKYESLPIKLDDDTVVLAWARDGAGLQAALSRLIES